MRSVQHALFGLFLIIGAGLVAVPSTTTPAHAGGGFTVSGNGFSVTFGNRYYKKRRYYKRRHYYYAPRGYYKKRKYSRHYYHRGGVYYHRNHRGHYHPGPGIRSPR